MSARRRSSACRQQRGVATLFVTALLCFALLLLVAHAHRNVIVEEQRSANDYRSTTAFEAAEAGLEWAIARANDAVPLDDACRPSADPAARSLRDRLLAFAPTSGEIAPTTWLDAGAPTPMQAACMRGAAGWTCSCPASGGPVLAPPIGPAITPAFAIEFAPSSRPGLVRIIATGCTRADSVCSATSDRGHEAAARLEATWALLPALRSAPVAALTVGGDLDAGSTALGVHNVDASSGLALDVGGRIAASSSLRVTAPAGSPLGASIVSGDASLVALSSTAFFSRWFGMDLRTWGAQPAARRLACAGDCTATIDTAIAAGARLLFIDGDLAMNGPATLGSADRPVAIVATGALRFNGAIAIHGVLHGASLAWSDAAAPAAVVRGATLVAGRYGGDAAPDFIRDAAVLARLKTGAGSLVRVNGGWKDF